MRTKDVWSWSGRRSGRAHLRSQGNDQRTTTRDPEKPAVESLKMAVVQQGHGQEEPRDDKDRGTFWEMAVS